MILTGSNIERLTSNINWEPASRWAGASSCRNGDAPPSGGRWAKLSVLPRKRGVPFSGSAFRAHTNAGSVFFVSYFACHSRRAGIYEIRFR
jgi:hypothetical protein